MTLITARTRSPSVPREVISIIVSPEVPGSGDPGKRRQRLPVVSESREGGTLKTPLGQLLLCKELRPEFSASAHLGCKEHPLSL